MKKVLVIGSGGREHALAKKLLASPRVERVYVAPGNGGTEEMCVNVGIDAMDFDGLIRFAREEAVDLTVVGPEDPLVGGIVDAFEKEGLSIIGPPKAAALLEGSKAHAKDFMRRHGIPTAESETVTSYEAALEALDRFSYPVVLKADGLAAGKGVLICETKEEALAGLSGMLRDKQFGEAGSTVVIERYLRGVEASLLCFVDGSGYLSMAPAQDYKKIGEGGTGPNTGGMGTFSPSPVMTPERLDQVKREVLDPFMAGIEKDGLAFRGVLFLGLMIEGDQMDVLEFNVRFGDPETQVILDRMETDLYDVFERMLEDRLTEMTLAWSDHHAVCVMLVSGGYPGAYEKGLPMTIDLPAGEVIHSGTIIDSGGTLVTNGGRVIGVLGRGENLESARADAYGKVDRVSFEGCYYRRDIGERIER
jgi:phosphoribosylamine--glycine ligase